MIQHNSHEPSHTDDAPLFYAPCPRCEQTMTLCRSLCWRCQQEMKRDLERANEAAYDLHYGSLEEPQPLPPSSRDKRAQPTESEFETMLRAERRLYRGLVTLGTIFVLGALLLAAAMVRQNRNLDNAVRQIEARSATRR
jgi:hypothetical protein